MTEYAPTLPHSTITRPFPELFFVTGTSTPNFMGQRWQFSRNMCVLRQGNDLTLVNSVRLDDTGLRELDALGVVRNVIKLGAFHGMDDAFYVDRYRANLCALHRMTHDSGKETDILLQPGPIPFCHRASLFCFETTKVPEGLIFLDQDDGVLVSCDSLQNWVRPDAYFDEVSAAKMKEIGFIRAANIGPGWRSAADPTVADFDRLLQLKFRHLIPAHGEIIVDEAHTAFSATVAAAFPSSLS